MTTPKSDSVAPLRWKVSPGGPACYINSVAVCDDGGTVLTGTFYHPYGGAVARRPVREHSMAASMRPADPPLEAVALSAYCYNRDGSLRWSDAITGWEGVYWVDVSGDGRYAAAGGNYSESPRAGFVRAYDARTGTVMLDYRTVQRVNQVVLSADGTWLVSAAESVVLFCRVQDTDYFTKVAEYKPDASSDNDVISVGLSDDGSTIVFCDYDGHIGVLTNSGGTLVPMRVTALPSGSYCHVVSLSPDGTSFAAGGANGQILCFDTAAFLQSGEATCLYETGSTGAIYGVAVGEDGRMFAGVVNEGTRGSVHLISIVNGEPALRRRFETAHNPNCVRLNTTRGVMAVADGHPDGTPGAFHVYEGVFPLPPDSEIATDLAWTYETPSNMSWPIAISRDGSAVVGGSDDSFVYYFST